MLGEDDVAPLRRDPDLFVRVAENALAVAEELREDYFRSTLSVARGMREEFRSAQGLYRIQEVSSDELDPCTAAFVDGGLSRIDVGVAVPLIARAGIFRVKQGERDLASRETFDHFPLMLGQLRGGLKANSKYGDIVRVLVELGAMVTALEDDRFSDIRILMLHGPLQFVSGPFFEHWFFPPDYEQMLGKGERTHVDLVLGKFTQWCNQCPLRGEARCRQTIDDSHLPAVCMMAFLQHYIFERAEEKGVLICGAIERSFGRGITRAAIRQLLESRPELLERLTSALGMQGRSLSVQTESILDATRYNDAVLLSLVLEPGEFIDWYAIDPRQKISDDRVDLFPSVKSTFVRVTSAKYPMRIEVPAEYGESARAEVLARAHEYASLLPNYAFPIGLDIVDKYAAVPGWMSQAYRHLILAQYGRLLAGEYYEMTDAEGLRALMVMQGNGVHSRRTRPKVQ